MKLTRKQKELINAYMQEFVVDDLISEWNVNCYMMLALEMIKDYEELEEDVRKYVEEVIK